MANFGALILAAGASTRIGYPKALLQWQGKSFLENIIGTLRHARVGSIRVVTSPDGQRLLRENLDLAGAELVVNPNPELGQFSSIRCGLRDLGVDVALLCLVDHPKISPALIFELKEACLGTDALAVIPRFRGKRGHPIALKMPMITAFLQAPDSATAKEVLLEHWPQILEIDTGDSGAVADIDTPADYEHFLEETFPAGDR